MSLETKERDYFWDNLKFMLILLVVIGHFVDYHTSSSQIMKNIFLWIYSFHMPLFIFVSGYFAKSTINKERFKIERICSYTVLYVSLKYVLAFVYKYVSNSSTITINLLTESAVPWYLMAMIIWLGITNCIKDVKPRYTLMISFILSCIVGYDKNIRDYLALSRVVVFYPFFLSGYYINKDGITKILNSKKLKIFALLTIGVSIFAVCFFGKELYILRPFFTGRNPYAFINIHFTGVFYRIIAFIISACMSVSILILTPKQKTIYSSFGSRTLQVYFLHALLLPLYNNSSLKQHITDLFPNKLPIICVLIGVAVTVVLSLKIFEFPFKKIMSFKLKI